MTMASQAESTFGVTKLAFVAADNRRRFWPESTARQQRHGGDCGLRLNNMARLQCAAVRRACPGRAAICKGLDCLCDAGYLPKAAPRCE
jgi:hypothetical protein